MNAHAGSDVVAGEHVSEMPQGWQILLADLSLILFMTTAAAVPVLPSVEKLSVTREPRNEALFSSLTTGEDIGAWLHDYRRDPREKLQITIRYRAGNFPDAMRRAQGMESTAIASGHIPQFELVQSDREQTLAYFVYAPPASGKEPEGAAILAQALHE